MVFYVQVVIVLQALPAPPLAIIFGLPGLLCAGIILSTGWRWVPLVGVLWYVVLLGLSVNVVVHDTMHPEFFQAFTVNAVLLALTVMTIVAGIAAAVQNYRAPTAASVPADRRRTPQWFSSVLAALAGLSLGAILVAAIPRADASAGVSPEALAALPMLTASQTRVRSNRAQVKLGETVALRLENLDNMGHSFDIDEFNVHTSMPPGKPTLALFKASMPGTYTFYCEISGHRKAGMLGTLIVSP
jgi:heme/copper-type cytochrome/quinol oxidase subunit 2